MLLIKKSANRICGRMTNGGALELCLTSIITMSMHHLVLRHKLHRSLMRLTPELRIIKRTPEIQTSNKSIMSMMPPVILDIEFTSGLSQLMLLSSGEQTLIPSKNKREESILKMVISFILTILTSTTVNSETWSIKLTRLMEDSIITDPSLVLF